MHKRTTPKIFKRATPALAVPGKNCAATGHRSNANFMHTCELIAWVKYFEARGYRVLRFWNTEVMKDTEAVLKVIWGVLSENH